MAGPEVQPGEIEIPASVTIVYLHVVEAVIESAREDFQSEGYDESALAELRQLWELKLMQAGAIQESPPEPRETQMPDRSISYESSEKNKSDALEIVFSPTTRSMTAPTDGLSSQEGKPGASERAGQGYRLESNASFGRPAAFMKPPAPWMNRKLKDVDVNIDLTITSEETREDHGHAQASVKEDLRALARGKRKRANSRVCSQPSDSDISQHDGAGDLFQIYQEVAEEDYNEPAYEESQGVDETKREVSDTQPTAKDTEEKEPPLNEDDDEDDDEGIDDLDVNDRGDEQSRSENLILAQFEKVTRSKNTWKCVLKDGIMNLNLKEYMFNKGFGEFEF